METFWPDAARLDAKEKARLRQQALGWLRADQVLWRTHLSGGQPADRATAQRTLKHWLGDSDLDGLRSEKALAVLPESERRDWQKLWSEVRYLLPPEKKD